MNRIDRLQAILTHLQSKKVVKASEIARRFDISLRTVYRDIRALEEAGVPIGSEAGIGYFVAEGYHLPPVSFTQEEASALIISNGFLQKWGDEHLIKKHNDAVYKVKSVLKSEQKEAIERLENRTSVRFYDQRLKPNTSLHFEKIEKALIHNNLLSIRYFSNYRQAFSEREVEPIGICFYSNNWHLIAYCHFRNDYRDFRLDRMEKVDVLTRRFQRLNRKTLDEYLNELRENTEITLIQLTLRKDILKYIQDIKFGLGLIEESEVDELYVKMTFGTSDIHYFVRWILILGQSVKEISPIEIKNQVKSCIMDLHHQYLDT